MSKRMEQRIRQAWEGVKLFGVLLFTMAAGAAAYHQYVVQRQAVEPVKAEVETIYVPETMPSPTPAQQQEAEKQIEEDPVIQEVDLEVEKADEAFQILTTAYCHGTITATGRKVRRGICAVREEWIGKTAMVWECKDSDTMGDFLGYWECLDTGFGADSDGDGIGSIQEGRVIDMYFPTQEEVREWMELTGGRVYVQLIDAEG